MRILSFVLLVVALAACKPQETINYEKEIAFERMMRNQEFLNPDESPLNDEQIKEYQALQFFPIGTEWKVEGKIEIIPNPEETVLKKSKESTDKMLKWAKVNFELSGQSQTLYVFKPIPDPLDTAFEDYLFIPFFDETNGAESYDNGRYLYPEYDGADKMVLDFNRSKNPYCAYNDRWNCTMPPLDNTVSLKVTAGEKKYGKHSEH